MSCIHYKFKSSLDYRTVTFDGLHLSLCELKRMIFDRERIRASDFDLLVTNAQTNEVYEGETAVVVRNSSVIVSRIPVEAQRKLPKIWDRGTDGVVPKQVTTETPSPANAPVKRMSAYSETLSEEEKLKKMEEESTSDYDPSRYRRKNLIASGVPPPNYICNRCNQPGHWIKMCPSLNIKRTTGIPKGELMETTPDDPQAMLTSAGTYAVPVLHKQAFLMGKAEKPFGGYRAGPTFPVEQKKQNLPRELLCTLCDNLLRDASLIPCCGYSYCDECIRHCLLESDDRQCPHCHENGVSPTTLIPNGKLREAVKAFQTNMKNNRHSPPLEDLPSKTTPAITASSQSKLRVNLAQLVATTPTVTVSSEQQQQTVASTAPVVDTTVQPVVSTSVVDGLSTETKPIVSSSSSSSTVVSTSSGQRTVPPSKYELEVHSFFCLFPKKRNFVLRRRVAVVNSEATTTSSGGPYSPPFAPSMLCIRTCTDISMEQIKSSWLLAKQRLSRRRLNFVDLAGSRRDWLLKRRLLYKRHLASTMGFPLLSASAFAFRANFLAFTLFCSAPFSTVYAGVPRMFPTNPYMANFPQMINLMQSYPPGMPLPAGAYPRGPYGASNMSQLVGGSKLYPSFPYADYPWRSKCLAVYPGGACQVPEAYMRFYMKKAMRESSGRSTKRDEWEEFLARKDRRRKHYRSKSPVSRSSKRERSRSSFKQSPPYRKHHDVGEKPRDIARPSTESPRHRRERVKPSLKSEVVSPRRDVCEVDQFTSVTECLTRDDSGLVSLDSLTNETDINEMLWESVSCDYDSTPVKSPPKRRDGSSKESIGHVETTRSRRIVVSPDRANVRTTVDSIDMFDAPSDDHFGHVDAYEPSDGRCLEKSGQRPNDQLWDDSRSSPVIDLFDSFGDEPIDEDVGGPEMNIYERREMYRRSPLPPIQSTQRRHRPNFNVYRDGHSSDFERANMMPPPTSYHDYRNRSHRRAPPGRLERRRSSWIRDMVREENLNYHSRSGMFNDEKVLDSYDRMPFDALEESNVFESDRLVRQETFEPPCPPPLPSIHRKHKERRKEKRPELLTIAEMPQILDSTEWVVQESCAPEPSSLLSDECPSAPVSSTSLSAAADEVKPSRVVSKDVSVIKNNKSSKDVDKPSLSSDVGTPSKSTTISQTAAAPSPKLDKLKSKHHRHSAERSHHGRQVDGHKQSSEKSSAAASVDRREIKETCPDRKAHSSKEETKSSSKSTSETHQRASSGHGSSQSCGHHPVGSSSSKPKEAAKKVSAEEKKVQPDSKAADKQSAKRRIVYDEESPKMVNSNSTVRTPSKVKSLEAVFEVNFGNGNDNESSQLPIARAGNQYNPIMEPAKPHTSTVVPKPIKLKRDWVAITAAASKITADSKSSKPSNMALSTNWPNYKRVSSSTAARPCCSDVMAVMNECPHSVVLKDMCADCGIDLRKQEGESAKRASISMIHSIPELQISHEEAIKHAKADEANLLANRKLVLLVDLDQTLIHTTNELVDPGLKVRAPPPLFFAFSKLAARHLLQDVHHFQLEGPQSVWYHMRLRPHTISFLRSMSQLYELHICTFGARIYAHTVAKILDPDGSIFGHRILSRDECFDPHLKTANLHSLFPCGEDMVCIIDDREDVWNYASNLVHVRPYRFFKHTGDINAPPGLAKTDRNTEHQFQFPHPDTVGAAGSSSDGGDQQQQQQQQSQSLAKKERRFPDVDEFDVPSEDIDRDDDDYLLYLEDILKWIHNAFYSAIEVSNSLADRPSLCSLIPSVRKSVLSGVNILFSGVVPNVQPIQSANIYRVVTMFGACVQENFVETDGATSRTTHLVAVRANTAKVLMAQKLGNVFIVNPDWVWCCVERWRRVDEALFPLDPTYKSSFPDRAITIENHQCGGGKSKKEPAGRLLSPAALTNGQSLPSVVEAVCQRWNNERKRHTNSEECDLVPPTVIAKEDEASVDDTARSTCSSAGDSVTYVDSDDEEMGKELQSEFDI
ncbi:DWNN domain protein [Trichuris suis]|nr:DWNN domain protein [Trichuris suis]